jgi:molecular chaperone GrpE (heat shock protein)
MLIHEVDKRISVTEVLDFMKNNFSIFPNTENKVCENCEKFKTSAEVFEKENEFQANEIQKKEDEVATLRTENKELNKRILKLTTEIEKLKIDKTESNIIRMNKAPQVTSFEITNELREYYLSIKYYKIIK